MIVSFVLLLLLSPAAHASTPAAPQPPPSGVGGVGGLPPATAAAALECDYAVAGGGWAGVYFAYRVATAADLFAAAATVCLFEASSRIGGRTYSVPVAGTEFTLDVGAYRFSPDMHLPGDLILNHFQLPTECYEPSCPPAYEDFGAPFMFNYTAPLVRLVDPATGLPAGYATAIDAMLGEMASLGENRVKVFTDSPVVDTVLANDAAANNAEDRGNNATEFILPPSSAAAVTLVLGGGTNVTAARATLLNLPRNHLFGLPSLAASLSARTEAMLKCIVFDTPPELFTPFATEPSSALTKAYVLYPDAWWVTRLNQTTGEWPVGQSFSPVETTVPGLYLNIHWNDGPTAPFTNDQGVEGLNGFLEVYYDVSNETFFSSVATPSSSVLSSASAAASGVDGPGRTGGPGSSEPLGELWGGPENPPANQAKLNELHAALLVAIADLIADAGVNPATLPLPQALVVGVWNRASLSEPLGGSGYTAPTKVYFAPDMSGDLAEACGVEGLTEDEYRTTALHPLDPTSASSSSEPTAADAAAAKALESTRNNKAAGTSHGAAAAVAAKAVPAVFLANNDFVAMNVYYMYGDWAEESLLMAERALSVLGFGKPPWLDAAYYDDKVLALA